MKRIRKRVRRRSLRRVKAVGEFLVGAVIALGFAWNIVMITTEGYGQLKGWW